MPALWARVLEPTAGLEKEPMKRIEEHLRETLQGEVEVITATELKKHLGECLTMTSFGKTYCIKRKGKIVGFLTQSVDITHEIKPDGTCGTLQENEGCDGLPQRP